MAEKHPLTTSAGPARDEAKALCAKDASCGKAVRDPAIGRDAGAGPSRAFGPARAMKGESRGGTGHSKGTIRPLPSGSKRGRANLPAKGSIGVGARKVAGGTVAGSKTKGAAAPLPNLAIPKPTPAKCVQKPSGIDTQSSGGWTKVSRRQRRRASAARTLQRQNAGESPDEPAVAPSRSQKRPLVGSGDSPQTDGDSKRTKVGSYAEALSGERVAIIPAAFPAEKFLASYVGAIQKAVISRLLGAPDPLPKITFGNIVGGALHISCGDKASSTWLSTAIGEGEIAGLSFKVVDARDLPKPVKMAWKTKIVGVQDSKQLLELLQRRNPDLRTDEWKVVGTSVAEASTRRIILMDRESADVIRKAGYQLHSGIDVSTFKLLEDVEKGSRGAEADPRAAPPDTEVATATKDDGVRGTDVANREGVEAGSRGGRASPLMTPEDLRDLAELYLGGRSSPMSEDAQDAQNAQSGSEGAADLSRPKKF